MGSFAFLSLALLAGVPDPTAREPAKDEVRPSKQRVDAMEADLETARREIAAVKKESAAARDARDRAAEDLERLQGDWTIIFVIDHGGEERETSGSGAFSIEGDRIQQWNEGFAVGVSGKITLDPSQKPCHIDIANEGKGYLGIYKFSDRGPVLMLSNEGGRRPGEFLPGAYKRRDDQGMMILKKK
jgi:uncharacterized protein (TIGR03067 family)